MNEEAGSSYVINDRYQNFGAYPCYGRSRQAPKPPIEALDARARALVIGTLLPSFHVIPSTTCSVCCVGGVQEIEVCIGLWRMEVNLPD